MQYGVLAELIAWFPLLRHRTHRNLKKNRFTRTHTHRQLTYLLILLFNIIQTATCFFIFLRGSSLMFNPVPEGITGPPCSWGTKLREPGPPVWGVSDETVEYGYSFWATRTIEWLRSKLQTRPLVREGAPQKQDRKFQTEHSDRK
jgi:hypothetical protein